MIAGAPAERAWYSDIKGRNSLCYDFVVVVVFVAIAQEEGTVGRSRWDGLLSWDGTIVVVVRPSICSIAIMPTLRYEGAAARRSERVSVGSMVV